MRFTIKAALLALGLVAGGAAQSRAAFVTYTITDIGAFTGYTTANVGQTYSGTGFVGLYEQSVFGSEQFAHLFGLEPDFSRTAMQVDVSGIAGATVLSATLTFDILDGGGSAPVTVTSYDADGNLGYFYTPPTNLGTAGGTATSGANSIDVTGLVASRVGASENWLGLHLAGNGDFMWTWTHADFGRNADSANVRLTIEYAAPTAVPAPAGVLLGLLGLPALGVAGRLRRRAAV